MKNHSAVMSDRFWEKFFIAIGVAISFAGAPMVSTAIPNQGGNSKRVATQLCASGLTVYISIPVKENDEDKDRHSVNACHGSCIEGEEDGEDEL